MTANGLLNPKYLTPGTMVGYYRVVDQLGAGGLAAVYKVEYDGRFYALKISTYSASDLAPEERDHLDERAKREFGALAGLRHPGIVKVHEFARFPPMVGYPYLIMDFVEGVPLYVWQAQNNPSLRTIVEVFIQLAEAVDDMHAHKVVHRDLKSDNVLVVVGPRGESRILIIDFNIASPASAYTLTMAGGVLGTPSHLTPEQCDHYFHHEDHPTERFAGGPLQDIHCVGFILYEMLAGRPPWVLGDDQVATMAAIRKIPPRPLASAAPGVPRELCDVVMRLLRRDPAERFQRGHDLKDALAALVGGLPTVPYPSRFPPRPRHSSSANSSPPHAATPTPPAAGSGRSTQVDRRAPARRSRWPLAAGAAVVMGVAGVGGGLWWAQASTARPRLGAPAMETPPARADSPTVTRDVEPRTAAPKLVLPATVVAAPGPAPDEPAPVVPIVPAPSAAPIPLAPRKTSPAKGATPAVAGSRDAATVPPAQPASSGVLVQVIRMNPDAPGEAASPSAPARALGAPKGLRFSGQLTADVVAAVGQRAELSLPRPLYHGSSAIFPSRTRLSGAVAAVDGGRATLHFRTAVLPDGRTVSLDANAVAADLQAGASCEVVLAAPL